MFFSKAEIARRTEEARPITERLAAAGCRFAQMEMPDNNGWSRQDRPARQRLSASGTAWPRSLWTLIERRQHLSHLAVLELENGFPKMVACPMCRLPLRCRGRRNVAGVLCDFYMEDGTPCPTDARHILRSARRRSKAELLRTRGPWNTSSISSSRRRLMRAERYGELHRLGRPGFLQPIEIASFEDLRKNS